MVRKLVALATILMFVLVGSGCGSTKGQSDEIVLGLTAPMSGDYAEYGNSFKNAVQLAIDKVNQDGGINGKKLKVVVSDSKNDPKEAANIAQKYVSDSSVMAVIGDFTTTSSLAGAPIYQRGGLVQLSPTSSHPDFTKQGNYMFRNIATQAKEGPIVADYTFNDLNKKRVAIIYIKNDWGIVAQEHYQKAVEKLGGNVVAVESFLPEQGKDFNAIITKVKEQQPDIVFLGMMYTDGALLAQQMRKQNMNIPLIGTSSLFSEELLKLGGSAVEGLYLTCSFYPADQRPEVQEFVTKYQAQYGKAPTMFAAQAYDAAGLIIQALKNGAKDRSSLRDALAAIKNYPGVTGSTSFDENRDVDKKLFKLMVKDGKYIPYKN